MDYYINLGKCMGQSNNIEAIQMAQYTRKLSIGKEEKKEENTCVRRGTGHPAEPRRDRNHPYYNKDTLLVGKIFLQESRNLLLTYFRLSVSLL
jgi:hypothetical protein